MKKIIASLVSVFSLIHFSYSQTTDAPIRQTAIGVSFFLNDFITPQRIRSTSLNAVMRDKQGAKIKEMAPGLAFNYAKGVTPHIDFTADLSGCFVDYPMPGKAPFGNNLFLLEADAMANFKLTTEKYWVIPYAAVGVGGHKYDVYYGAFIPVGLGMRLNLFDEAGVNLTGQYRIPVINETTNYHFYYSLGIYGIVGKKKEPPPPPVVVLPPQVAPPPPPVDTDKDGINDDNDACPTVFGVARYKGCPIPDTDKDGINDEEDKCPNEFGVARYQGCPVPDRDKDGVSDEEDKCPDIPGLKENNGCPEIKPEVIKKIDYAAANILFVTGSAKLNPSSYKGLDEVVQEINNHPGTKLSIDGHTDNTGTDATNNKLSQQRADAVKKYFVSKGIDENRMTATGHGSSQPIADNKTAAGKKKNRRVEMKLSY